MQLLKRDDVCLMPLSSFVTLSRFDDWKEMLWPRCSNVVATSWQRRTSAQLSFSTVPQSCDNVNHDVVTTLSQRRCASWEENVKIHILHEEGWLNESWLTGKLQVTLLSAERNYARTPSKLRQKNYSWYILRKWRQNTWKKTCQRVFLLNFQVGISQFITDRNLFTDNFQAF